jgi:RNA polymerase sigma-70 factor (ECF subfamily)
MEHAGAASHNENAESSALVRAAQSGDREAFARLYERHAPVVHGVLLSHGAEDDAPDLLHDVFLTALQQIRTLRDASRFGAWVATIARNAARMARRKNIRLVPLDGDTIAAPSNHAGLDGATVLAAIRSLPEAYRETLVLRLVEGLSGPEIAEHTGLEHGSVRVNLHRGMAMLRQKLRGSA